jgi:hypothetical protein
VITKRKITENKKIQLSTKSIKIIISNPDGTDRYHLKIYFFWLISVPSLQVFFLED